MKKFFSKVISLIVKNKIKTIIIASSVVLVSGGVTTFLIAKNSSTNKSDTNQCTIRFDSSGGEVIKDLKFKCGTVVNDPGIKPKKEGFEFTGWLLNDEDFSFGVKIDKNITIVASFIPIDSSKIVIVTFDSNGGSIVNPIDVLIGSKISKPISPTREGYSFKGWYFGDIKFDFSTEITENIILVAKWSKDNNNYKNDKNNSSTDTINNTDLSAEKKISNLIGTWYYENDSSITIRANYGYGGNQRRVEIWWDNIDLKKLKLYPNYGNYSGYFIYFPIDEKTFNKFLSDYNFTSITGSSVVINNKYKFTKNKKTVDLSAYDKYIGTWYQVGGSGSYINIEKESAGQSNSYIYRIHINTVTDSGSSLYDVPGEGISQRMINEKDTVFDRNGISLSNGYLVYKGNTYSKNKNVVVIKTNSVSIDIGTGSNSVNIGETKKYSYKLNPSNATDFAGSWYSEDNSIATVDQQGLITGLKKGTTKICYKTNKDIKACEYINVIPIKVTGISLSRSELTLNVGESKSVEVIVTPSNATDKSYIWVVSKFDVVSTKNGVITGLNPGTITLTAEANDGRHQASMTVNVVAIPVSSITLDRQNLSIKKNQIVKLNATISPENAYNKNVNWTSSDSKIASVNSKGEVLGKGRGTAIITAQSAEGNYQSTCEVDVSNNPLKASATASISYECNNNGCSQGVKVTINAYEGDGNYTYSYKVYRDDVLLGNYDSKSKDFPLLSGVYRVEYTVNDTDGQSVSGTSTTTITV